MSPPPATPDRRASGDRPSPPPGWWRRRDHLVIGLAVGVVAVAALLPDPVPLGAARLFALVAIVAGAAVTVARTRAVDLAIGPTVGLAAVAGGAVPSTLGWPTLTGVVLGAVAGALLGAVAGATIGRVGRQLGALATLALGGAVIAVLAALEVTGGVVGFHAVGLPTPAGERVDALLVGAVALGVLLASRAVVRSRTAAAAAVAAADPAVARSHGRAPAGDAAVVGACAGGLAGTGGVLLAMVDGSVVPAAYGLELTATVVAAAAVGGAGLLGPALGVLLVWGPATLWPLSPLGAVPVLLTAGPLALLLLAVRGGRALTDLGPSRGSTGRASHPGRPAVSPAGDRGGVPEPPSAGTEGAHPRLRLRATPTPSGPVSLAVSAGEVVAIVGPNGAGKSTLLGRIGGQLPDVGTVELDGRTAPRGPRRRARSGVVRTWQRTPSLDERDLDRLVGVETPGAGELARVRRRDPRVVLFDEPTDHPVAQLAATLRSLRAGGAAVLVVDHRDEVLALSDRVIRLGPDGADRHPAAEERPS